MPTTRELNYIEEERAACAEIARMRGCLCLELAALEFSDALEMSFAFAGSIDYRTSPPTVTRHDPQCPEAIALAIEGRG